MKIISCNLILFLKFSSKIDSKASDYALVPIIDLFFPYPKATVLNVLILSIVSCANFVKFVFMDGMDVFGVTLGTYLFSSSIFIIILYFLIVDQAVSLNDH